MKSYSQAPKTLPIMNDCRIKKILSRYFYCYRSLTRRHFEGDTQGLEIGNRRRLLLPADAHHLLPLLLLLTPINDIRLRRLRCRRLRLCRSGADDGSQFLAHELGGGTTRRYTCCNTCIISFNCDLILW